MCRPERREPRPRPPFQYSPYGPVPRRRHEHPGRHEPGDHGPLGMPPPPPPPPPPPREHDDRFEGRPGFGIRRPLRFLVHRLGLDEKQVAALARILDDLKIERAQAEVDDRRALAEFADAMAGDAFDESKAASAGERRVQSVMRVRDTLDRALKEIHGMLTPEQRERFAYLIRPGVISI
ncbi:MAG: Spy/CpxP family protein refolding chaperone [Isosphaeraceae bacterium]